MSKLRLYTYGPFHSLPTSGPFGLKLMMALRMADRPFELRTEDDQRKGPKRKSPWIEDGTVRMGDTHLILEYLGVDLDGHLDRRQRAEAHVLRRMLEEHWHQVDEYEIFLHPAGFAGFDAWLAKSVPAFAVPLLARMLRRHFRKHLFERGLARHDMATVEAFGKADLDALESWMEGRTWAVADEPCLVDCSLFGLLAPAFWYQSPTPCFTYAREQPNLRAYCERVRERFFPEVESLSASEAAAAA